MYSANKVNCSQMSHYVSNLYLWFSKDKHCSMISGGNITLYSQRKVKALAKGMICHKRVNLTNPSQIYQSNARYQIASSSGIESDTLFVTLPFFLHRQKAKRLSQFSASQES